MTPTPTPTPTPSQSSWPTALAPLACYRKPKVNNLPLPTKLKPTTKPQTARAKTPTPSTNGLQSKLVTTLTSRQSWARRKARAHWSPIVATGTVTCRRCHKPIRPTQPWHTGHPGDNPAANGNIDDDLAPEHAKCNQGDYQATNEPTFGW